METNRRRKPKLVLDRNGKKLPPAPGGCREDFAMYASYRINPAHQYIGRLKVVRQTDGRLLYPFEGAAAIGPYLTREEAIQKAEEIGEQIIQADINLPELE